MADRRALPDHRGRAAEPGPPGRSAGSAPRLSRIALSGRGGGHLRPMGLIARRTRSGAGPAWRRHVGRLSGGDADFSRARRRDRIRAAALRHGRSDARRAIDDSGRPGDRRRTHQRLRLAVDLHRQRAARAPCRAADPSLDAARSNAGRRLRPADRGHRSCRRRAVRGFPVEPDDLPDEAQERAALARFGGRRRL